MCSITSSGVFLIIKATNFVSIFCGIVKWKAVFFLLEDVPELGTVLEAAVDDSFSSTSSTSSTLSSSGTLVFLLALLHLLYDRRCCYWTHLYIPKTTQDMLFQPSNPHVHLFITKTTLYQIFVVRIQPKPIFPSRIRWFSLLFRIFRHHTVHLMKIVPSGGGRRRLWPEEGGDESRQAEAANFRIQEGTREEGGGN